MKRHFQRKTWRMGRKKNRRKSVRRMTTDEKSIKFISHFLIEMKFFVFPFSFFFYSLCVRARVRPIRTYIVDCWKMYIFFLRRIFILCKQTIGKNPDNRTTIFCSIRVCIKIFKADSNKILKMKELPTRSFFQLSRQHIGYDGDREREWERKSGKSHGKK